MLDDTTRAHCLHIEKVAAEQGFDLWITLEAAGLLVTHDKKVLIAKDTIGAAIHQLDQQQPVVLGNIGGGQTVTGAVRGCVRFLEMYLAGLR